MYSLSVYAYSMCTNIFFLWFCLSLTSSFYFLQVIELCRPSDSRLEHVDFECLFSSLSLRLLLRVFASLLLERRVIFTADKLRLEPCCHIIIATSISPGWDRWFHCSILITPLRSDQWRQGYDAEKNESRGLEGYDRETTSRRTVWGIEASDQVWEEGMLLC